MREQTYTVARCYPTGNGWHVVLLHGQRGFPADQELPEGASVVIRDGRAVRPE